MNKKIITIQPLKTRWKAPDINSPWSNNSFANFTRLLQSDAYHIDDPEIPLDGDIYFISSFDIANIEKEIRFAQKLKTLRKKIVVSFSQDLRFLIGNCLEFNGIHYNKLCEYADVVLQGISPKIRCYGRYQEKAIDFGLPFERMVFPNIKSYKDRQIDIFMSNNLGEENFGFSIETLYMLKEKFPDKVIVYSTNKQQHEIPEDLYKSIDFVPAGLINHLPNSKMYLNLELRPRPGRSLLESWYSRTPFVACESAYHSNLFPDFTFQYADLIGIVELCEKLLNSDYNLLISKAEKIAEYDYFDNFYKRLLNKLYI